MFDPEDITFTKALIEHALADNRGRKRWSITRMMMYRALENLLAEHDSASAKCLCISQSHPLADVLGLKKSSREITKFPDVNILGMPYSDDAFDFVVSDQVLEHVEGSPFDGVRETLRVAKPGGWIVHTTCFMNFMHQLPFDFWRFTPQSLELLVRHCGAEVVTSGGWGNRAAWTYMQLGYRDEKVPEVSGNPVFELASKNEKKWPVHTWVVARKLPRS